MHRPHPDLKRYSTLIRGLAKVSAMLFLHGASSRGAAHPSRMVAGQRSGGNDKRSRKFAGC